MTPKWFRDIPVASGHEYMSPNLEGLDAPTIRKCPAMNDYFSTGITIPLWTDLEFYYDSTQQSLEWKHANIYEHIGCVSSHSPVQFPTLAGKYMHVKLTSPWIAHCNRNIQWFMTKPTHLTSAFDDQHVLFCDGMIQFKNNFVTNVNLFFPIRDSSYSVKFEVGQPFQRLIPLTENKINMKVEFCTSEYFIHASMHNRRLSFSPSKLYNILNKKSKEK